MRKLASIQRILEINDIPDAENIQVATVQGWHVVVKKGEFYPDTWCVFVEIDSILPPKPEFAFLEKVKYRIKTIRLRGQISQGIAFPIHILGPNFPYTSIKEGDDVTDILEIKKYEPPMPAELSGVALGNFPGFLPKTDETRVQSCPEVLERYQGKPFFVTEKLDGSSCTFVVKNDVFHVCSRNLDLKESETNTLWRLAREMDLENKIRRINEITGDERHALQGEVVGEGIQKNTLKLKGQRIYFFNIYDFIDAVYLNFANFQYLSDFMDIDTVPVIKERYSLPKTVDELVAFATRKSIINPEGWAEGIVVRPLQEERDPDLGRLSFKAINPEFLLKND